MAILDLAVRTADTNSTVTTMLVSKFYMVVAVTDIVSSPSITPKLELFDPASSGFIAVWTASAALSVADTTTTYFFTDVSAPYASIDNCAEVVEVPISEQIRVMVGHANANAITYSINFLTIPV